MLPHHVNSWTIPVDLGIVSRESAKIPKTGTDINWIFKAMNLKLLVFSPFKTPGLSISHYF